MWTYKCNRCYAIDTFLTDVFLKVIDCLLSELKKRFSIISNAVMRGIQCLNPKSKTFLDITILQDMATKYDASTEDLIHEVHQAKRLLSRKAAERITVSTLQHYWQSLCNLTKMPFMRYFTLSPSLLFCM